MQQSFKSFEKRPSNYRIDWDIRHINGEKYF